MTTTFEPSVHVNSKVFGNHTSPERIQYHHDKGNKGNSISTQRLEDHSHVRTVEWEDIGTITTDDVQSDNQESGIGTSKNTGAAQKEPSVMTSTEET